MLNKKTDGQTNFEVNRAEILDDDLQNVSGGWASFISHDYFEVCPFCHQTINQTLGEHENFCPVTPWYSYSRV